MKVSIILSTIDKEHERAFCDHLVKRRFAACIERIDVTSVYWWEGRMWNGGEVSLIIKTLPARLAACIKEIEKTHPYDCPQIIVLEGDVPNKPYFGFLKDSVSIDKKGNLG